MQHDLHKRLFALVLLGLCRCGDDPVTSAPSPTSEPLTFHCRNDASCPEVTVAGDPASTDFFHGYGDPSLEYDADSDTLWMAYSWLDTLVYDAGPPAREKLAVRTHLASSTDHGQTFTFERAVNQVEPEIHPITMAPGNAIHEVSTLVKQPDGRWQIMWFHYITPADGTQSREEIRFDRSVANAPGDLGDSSESWIQGSNTSDSHGTRNLLSNVPELSDCTIFTEPGLYSDSTTTYLAASCLVISPGGSRDVTAERIVLLRQESNGGYTYLGVLFNHDDALDMGADRIEQIDITLARNGDLIAIVTPIIDNSDPQHQGCQVFTVADLANAQIARDEEGVAIPRAIITADGNGLGPGLCTYDAASESGVLLVITTFDLATPDIEFSLRATGVHP